MSFVTAQKAVDIYFSNLRRNLAVHEKYDKTILFYGGEPLLNFSLIKGTVAYTEETYSEMIEKMEDRFSFLLITNGTLISEELVSYLCQHKTVSVAISLDGKEAAHNKERIFTNGKGSFNSILKGISLLREKGIDVAISCTIGSHNIDELTSLLDLHEQYGFSSINFNTLLDTEKDEVDHEYMAKATGRMLEFFEIAREKGVYEDRVMRKLRAFVSSKIHPYDCQATGNQIVCSPDGKIGVCQEGIGSKQFFFSDVDTKLDFCSEPIIREWNERTPLNMPQCYDCSAIGVCGGGCAYSAWLRNGSIWAIDDRFCAHSLMTLEWMIWDAYNML